MNSTQFPRLSQGSGQQQHAVANPEAVVALRDAIAADPDRLAALHNRHIVSIKHFDADTLRQLLRLAARFESDELAAYRPLDGRVMTNVYLDNSRSQTWLSFNSAWLRLGGTFLNVEKTVAQGPGRSGMPIDELAELCNGYGDLSVLRTHANETPYDLLDQLRVPVINAGNGEDENPTNALADLYTLFKWRPDLLRQEVAPEKRLQVGIVGGPSRTRTIRSFLYGLSLFPQAVARIVLLERDDLGFSAGQREALEDAGFRVETVLECCPEETVLGAYQKLLPDLDMLYVHRTQAGRLPRQAFVEAKSCMKQEALVLCPEIRSDDFSEFLNDSPHNGYFAQARGAVAVRMAAFCAVLGQRP